MNSSQLPLKSIFRAIRLPLLVATLCINIAAVSAADRVNEHVGPFFEAIKQSNVRKVEMMIKADPFLPDSENDLHWTALGTALETLLQLQEKDEPDMAMIAESLKVLVQLLEYGVSVHPSTFAHLVTVQKNRLTKEQYELLVDLLLKNKFDPSECAGAYGHYADLYDMNAYGFIILRGLEKDYSTRNVSLPDDYCDAILLQLLQSKKNFWEVGLANDKQKGGIFNYASFMRMTDGPNLSWSFVHNAEPITLLIQRFLNFPQISASFPKSRAYLLEHH